jgi:hypothetical protein
MTVEYSGYQYRRFYDSKIRSVFVIRKCPLSFKPTKAHMKREYMISPCDPAHLRQGSTFYFLTNAVPRDNNIAYAADIKTFASAIGRNIYTSGFLFNHTPLTRRLEVLGVDSAGYGELPRVLISCERFSWNNKTKTRIPHLKLAFHFGIAGTQAPTTAFIQRAFIKAIMEILTPEQSNLFFSRIAS